MLRGFLHLQSNHCNILIAKFILKHLRVLSSFTESSISVEDASRNDKYKEEMESEDFPYSDVPRPGKTWERKPYVNPMKILIKRAKEEKKIRRENPCCVVQEAPANGLIVSELIDVAQRVYFARESLMHGLSLLLEHHNDNIFVHRCRYCREVHIGKWGHEIRTCEGSRGATRSATHVWRRGGIRDVIFFPKSYHIYDRALNPRVGHKERFEIPRLPAIVELCIQAGFELEDFPTKRRTKPVYSIEGRIVDFEPQEYDVVNIEAPSSETSQPIVTSASSGDTLLSEDQPLTVLAVRTLNSFLEMRLGAMEIMKKYGVLTCGYCNGVQVGPKGHKVRKCKATDHQQRDGLHAWQEATIDDIIGPNYVWHAKDPQGPPLVNVLKRYYGKAPAVVEICVQAGATVPHEYWSMMRLDVVVPSCDEYDLVC